MPGDAELLRVAASLYEAALDPDSWPVALTNLGGLVGGTWTVLGAFRGRGAADLSLQNEGADPDIFALFRDRYNLPDTNPAIPALLAAGPGAIIVREQVVPDAEWHRSALYRELYRPLGLYHGLGACVQLCSPHIALVGINRSADSGPFRRAELELLRRGLAHLRLALTAALRLAAADPQGRLRTHETAWDALALGMIMLDDTGRVAWANQAALALLERSEGLAMRAGFLVAGTPGESLALQSLIRNASNMRRGNGEVTGGALSLSRPQRRPLGVLVSPLHLGPLHARPPSVALFVTDPERQPELADEALQRLYGLTRREAALAVLLMSGADLRAASAQLHVSMHTVRTYLRFIFLKTCTRRQGELVALLLRGPAGLR